MTHSLASKDVERRTADCSVCGPVKISKSGTGWVCAEKAKANARAWKARNPDRDRTSKTEHKLTWKNPQTGTGLCAVCDVVEIVPWGRGYACPNGDAAKTRVHFQDAPATYCDACKLLDGDLVWLTVDGCPRCNETDLNAMFAKDAADQRLMGDTDWSEMGMHVEGLLADPEYMPDYESAVPGWHTIG